MKSIMEVAKELAEAHRKEDPETLDIYLANDQYEVRLVEVSKSLARMGEVLPFRFKARPDQGIPYASVVVLLSPEEWEELNAGKLSLPAGWGEPGKLEKIA